MSDFQIDWQREERTGTAEAILCDGKTAGQIAAMLEAAAGRRLLLTRLSAEKRAALPDALDYDPLSRTALSGELRALRDSGIGIVCAGTSDLPVAGEARRTLAFHGLDAPVIADVGVAGLWRLMDKLDRIRGFRVLIAVAGMEGALFSVLAGLVRAPVIAVPTSVGYGVAEGGRAALSTALATCAPGVVTVNIDNGFGAACAAIRMTAAGRGA
ncbi:nickel pincer cofactor biosynthesis protein LarB [Azospirillum sp. RWY-5-1]|uniref:Nickel pincer cofactor biosynthesis protein LarB n=1 Tax=Azospirillum oleiclasticum TaxID=2735135 RepID=A0ABX2TF30_9PROT|nr:nickel pincer cofactor biosynthesis protein LarB [Azospirillum oleiclasticum]NYZ16068.1 nickel pincer cofactor biosynthesis protein LarB [Azospirillum oleiclasticum]NYZ22949.1 nickel pincer cofactor biosynthesis protein LarB [Azospirillum oleiclasticum]